MVTNLDIVQAAKSYLYLLFEGEYMMQWLKNKSIYKSTYALTCIIISEVISFFAGYDYRLTIINHAETETTFASYGELLIVIILSISGLIVLINYLNRIQPVVCILLIVAQVWSYFFCKMYENTTHVAIIKWFSLLVAPFTLLLWEQKKNLSDDNGNGILHDRSVIKQISFTLIGTLLTFLGIIATYQSGVLYAEKSVNNIIRLSMMYSCVGIIMVLSGVFILFIRKRNTRKMPLFATFTLLITSGVYLFLGAIDIPILFFYVLVMLVFSVVILFITISKLYI